MKHTSQQMIQALKDGKSFWFYHISDSNLLYKATLVNGAIIVEWEDQQTDYPFDNGKPTCVDSWICTKIEGEETMTNKPPKHAELIKLWADTGCQIQYYVPALVKWIDVRNNPSWEPDIEYRVKPTLVKKWKWVFSDDGVLGVTGYCYTEQEFNSNFQNLTLIQKVDSTMIEVEE